MTRLVELLRTDRPLVMGILNVTPDSFSDAGQFLRPEIAVNRALEMVRQGADIIDIGGESTRPGAQSVNSALELERVLPVIQALRKESDVAISLDTSKAAVMSSALPHDIDLINDVKALQAPGALEVAVDSGLPVCLMHMKGEPRTMQQNPHYADLFAELMDFFRERLDACQRAGLTRDRIILDVGFGFGKTPAHNLQLINRLEQFLVLQCPLLVGLSRKSTIGKITEDRLTGSVAGALAAIVHGARIVRVHDVAETVAAVRVWRSIQEERLIGLER
ncbi:MAG: dihydropteroate synthase [Proteobacteria bacterium]|nr:dihydropteroate synthase [Pseudomonadota bacterium]